MKKWGLSPSTRKNTCYNNQVLLTKPRLVQKASSTAHFQFLHQKTRFITQEKLLDEWTTYLKAQESVLTDEYSIFKAHQKVFNQIIERFDIYNDALWKVKTGYDSILDRLRDLSKEEKIPEVNSCQFGTESLEEKLSIKKQEISKVVEDVTSLITDITKENSEYYQEIEAIKYSISRFEEFSLDKESYLERIRAKLKKKERKLEIVTQEFEDVDANIKSFSIHVEEDSNSIRQHLDDILEVRKKITNAHQRIHNKKHQIAQIENSIIMFGERIIRLKTKESDIQADIRTTEDSLKQEELRIKNISQVLIREMRRNGVSEFEIRSISNNLHQLILCYVTNCVEI